MEIKFFELVEMNLIVVLGAEFKDILKIKVEKWCSGGP